MVIFHSYVKLPEGTQIIIHKATSRHQGSIQQSTVHAVLAEAPQGGCAFVRLATVEQAPWRSWRYHQW